MVATTRSHFPQSPFSPYLLFVKSTGGRDGTMEGAMGYRDRCNRGIRGVIDITKTLASRTGRKGV